MSTVRSVHVGGWAGVGLCSAEGVGGPLSCYLFLFILDPLHHSRANASGVVGLSAINRRLDRLLQSNPPSIPPAFMLQVFEAAPGQQLKILKSDIIPSRTLTAALLPDLLGANANPLSGSHPGPVARNVCQHPRPVPHAPGQALSSLAGVLSHPSTNVPRYACGDCQCLLCIPLFLRTPLLLYATGYPPIH